MKFRKTLKGFTALVLVVVLSAVGMTAVLASDKTKEDVGAEEDAEVVESLGLEEVDVDPESDPEADVSLEEDSESEVVDTESVSLDEVSDAVAESESDLIESEPEEAEDSAAEDIEASETTVVNAGGSEEQTVAANTETVVGTITDLEVVDTVSAEELLEANKEGIYVALRNAGMAHVGAASVMAVMDATSEFEVLDGGLLGWTDEWKEALDEYSGDKSSSYAYQIAFLLETIENPKEDINFDFLKSALMSDDTHVLTDVWYFIQYYSNKVNPDNEIDINDCLKLAREYVNKYDAIKDSYADLTSVFEMTESVGGQTVAEYACNFVGNPYVWGGTSLTNGCDCSGFIQSVYAHFGVSLPHYSGSLRSVGYEVSAAEMQPGDIICYSGHCAIYIGNGRIVHASNSKPYPEGGIKISSNYNYRTVLAIRRVNVPTVSEVSEVSDVIDIEPVVLTKPEEA